MDKFRNRLIKFMYGRYGTDQLYFGIFAVAFTLMIINMFVGSAILSGLTSALLLIGFLRVFSKNIYRRQRENVYFLKIAKPVIKSAKVKYKRLRDVKSYRYRKCPDCQQTLRLKRKTGKHKTVCPKCGTKFDVVIRI